MPELWASETPKEREHCLAEGSSCRACGELNQFARVCIKSGKAIIQGKPNTAACNGNGSRTGQLEITRQWGRDKHSEDQGIEIILSDSGGPHQQKGYHYAVLS